MSAYCTAPQLVSRFGDKVKTWAGSDDVLREALEDASREIDGYLISAGYTVPLITAPALVGVHALSIAAYRLLVRKGLVRHETDPGQLVIIEGYKSAVRFCEQVARGVVRLRTSGSDTAPPEARRVVRSGAKLNMRGFV